MQKRLQYTHLPYADKDTVHLLYKNINVIVFHLLYTLMNFFFPVPHPSTLVLHVCNITLK